MSITIGHASLAENGTVYGSPGDQTGREVCTRNWYNGGWLFMAIHPNPDVRERHARAVEAACANDNVGYSWSGRNTLYEQAKAVGMDLSKIRVKCNCDCSSLQNCAAVASGAPGVSYGDNGWVTSTMFSALKSAGYAIIRDSALLKDAAYCVRGAIYVSTGHTVCGLSDGSKAATTLAAAGIPATQNKLSTPQAVEVPTQNTPKTETCSVELPVLRQGGKGEPVRMMQGMLIAKGFRCGAAGADGDFGPATLSAVNRFQRAYNLEVDGIIGAHTWAALLGL